MFESLKRDINAIKEANIREKDTVVAWRKYDGTYDYSQKNYSSLEELEKAIPENCNLITIEVAVNQPITEYQKNE